MKPRTRFACDVARLSVACIAIVAATGVLCGVLKCDDGPWLWRLAAIGCGVVVLVMCVESIP